MNTLSKGHIIITIDPELFCFPRNVDEYKNERTEKEISLKMIKTDSFICRKKWLTDFFFCNFSNINSPVRQKRHDKNSAQWLGYIFGNIILDSGNKANSKFNVCMYYIRPFFTKKTIYNKVEHVKSAYIDITLLCSIYRKIVIWFLSHKNQNWHCWSLFSKQLVQSPLPPSLIGLKHTKGQIKTGPFQVFTLYITRSNTQTLR